jgi:GT2 family glycosyltransferase
MGPADLAPCAVRHVRAAAPFPAIEADPGLRAVYAVFWRDGRPLGGRVLVAGELPVPAPAVPALAADAMVRVTPEAALPAGDAPAPSDVSVVVCTRDRPDDLRRCLAALALCEPAPREVIVVDNAPAGAAAVVAGFPGVVCLPEPAPGLSNARNAGVRAARGAIVAFTDDDVEVAPDWIARLVAPFADPAVACVTGLVLPADLSTPAACFFEFAAGGLGKRFDRKRFDPGFLREGPRLKAPEVWRIGAGANMAVRRDAFARVGLFDPRLGAGASGCSEDSELWFRLLAAGDACFYEPAAVVAHHHRADMAALARQMRAYARGHVVALFVQHRRDREPAHLVRAFLTLPRYFLKLAWRDWLAGDRAGRRLALVQLRGALEGPFAALRWLRRPGPPRLTDAGDRR